MPQEVRKGSGRAATVNDVARAAGVSTASVSRVINGKINVSSEMRARIETAIRDLGYQPDSAARSLASGRFRRIGAIVPTLENISFARAVEALQRSLAEENYALSVLSSNYDPDHELFQARSLVAGGIDGLMLVGTAHRPELYELVESKKLPLVNTWAVGGPGHAAYVGFDNEGCALRLTTYLLDLGHTEFGVISGMTKWNDRAAGRVAGVRTALARRGLALPQERLIERTYKILEGQLAMRAMLSAEPRPTAVICGNDTLAFGAMIECRAQNIRVPDDISIAGFDDLEFSPYLDPPLTTMHVPSEEIGLHTAKYLCNRISGRPAAEVTQVNINLVVRGSTGPRLRS